MDTLRRVWPSLDESQQALIEQMALALAGSESRKAEYMTVAQAAQRYQVGSTSIYRAIDMGILPFTTPVGQTKPRYVKVSDFEQWRGMR